MIKNKFLTNFNIIMNNISFNLYDFFGYLASGLLILSVVDYVYTWEWVNVRNIPLGKITLIIIVAYIIGHIVSHISNIILEDILLRKIIGPPEYYLLNNELNTKIKKCFPDNFKSLPENIRTKIKENAKQKGISCESRELFLHCHTVVKNDTIVHGRLLNVLNLYGFARNISLSLLIIAIILIISVINNSKMNNKLDIEYLKLILSFLSIFFSYIMFLRFLKFYRQYRVEVFTTYAESKNV